MTQSTHRHSKLAAALRAAVLEGPGLTDTELRAALESYGAAFGGRAAANHGPIPLVLQAYVDKVARHAHDVTDADVDVLRHARYSEDEIFEITTSVALGAGLGRLERGLAALRGDV